MQRGRFEVVGAAGMPSSVVVFDDGIVVVVGSKAATAGRAFGAIGAAIAVSAARRGLTKKMATIDALGPGAPAAAAAASVTDARLLTPGEVTGATIAKGLGKARKLTFSLVKGTVKLRFASKKTPVTTVVGLLQPLLGERLRVEPAAQA